MAIRTPVAVFIYNRTEHLLTVLGEICKARPPKVFVFADGPQPNDDDRGRCRLVRQIADNMAWPCPVSFKYSDRNLGCSARLVSGIERVFSETDEAIFLEDDTLPSSSFFQFCDELVTAYRQTTNVMMISGVNPLDHWCGCDASHFFSAVGNSQAWASWKRAWAWFPTARNAWSNELVRSRVRAFLNDDEQFIARSGIYELPNESARNSWDYQWSLARQMQCGLTAVPSKNLAVHAGRGATATHLKKRTILDGLARLHEIDFPVRCPEEIKPDRAYDRFLFEVTHNQLTEATAKLLAQMLAARGQTLLGFAVLRHCFEDKWTDVATDIGLAPKTTKP